ncbi:TIGR02117 family protein [Pasteurella atlantica]|uniref:TIGR02117 family protein n=1 Tax=Pasteurellaceae TaxID=712 RepID=UPI00275E3A65|nr:TIGR02117 family protein [Pasteurella atlantica]MDP8033641.1 TIGR02117 family protein [Pasteurella atlantica]MDP8035579.1 TIGR02117 family protein [Pasteurella atlantica]MDP8037530.1 TIGR02117 family protein [Pasteurella atlantica]MDP8047879.1 TIGR02117 family protein [Pasteurella atlantica]MDP8049834.1 TIGR02117 family protein [Pasteurella atlantica]
MKILRKLILTFLSILTTYIVVSLILGSITVERTNHFSTPNQSIYLTSNGIHLDIVLPKEGVSPSLLSDIEYYPTDRYLAFGWGDENFYLNTPTWKDLTFKTVFKAIFLKSTALLHVTRYQETSPNWVEVKVTTAELQKLNHYIANSFITDNAGKKVLLKDKGYTFRDYFYKAKGSYSMFNTCNSWANNGFKQSGLKASLWTPFDFGLLNKYR